MDWKDMLSHLRDELPQAEESAEETADEIRAEKQGLKKETIRIVVEKKGRKGKTATIAEGFTCDDDELGEVASKGHAAAPATREGRTRQKPNGILVSAEARGAVKF